MNGITVTGTVSVLFDNTGKTSARPSRFPGSTDPGVQLDLAHAAASFAITGGQLGVLGQTLSGDFAFSDTTGTVVVAASNVSLSLGGGVLSITNGTGRCRSPRAGSPRRSPGRSR